MAKQQRDWAWRRLLGVSGEGGKVKPLNYRRPDFMENKDGQTVRYHVPHPTTPALERFTALTRRVFTGDDHCIVFRGGDTFRADDDTVATPARFYWETTKGEKLGPKETLKRNCKTPRCVKHRVKR